MATIKFIPESRQSLSAMKGVISYCLQEKKVADNATGQRMVSGISCDGENSFIEFLTTKQAYRKTNGINFYHYVQSFSPDENITPQEVHAVAREFAERAWPGHEILVATHCDADHLHSHFVINSVGFENGITTFDTQWLVYSLATMYHLSMFPTSLGIVTSALRLTFTPIWTRPANRPAQILSRVFLIIRARGKDGEVSQRRRVVPLPAYLKAKVEVFAGERLYSVH